ncbi:MAG: hypothetical protein CVU71_07885 [Deltaproteobacteria bacterium HGW-Deltaproteobacteria-6]|jgi:hypothetical protein|nr:MAG: hypothetical protein CVU71_07885 [Deltaproteobacteria bacterium HGW-Deltaproteobacteria-6]
MKRFWLVLLSLGLIVAFSTSAMAVDVKFNGEYYAAGIYQKATDLRDGVGPSAAMYYQRLRLGTEFIVSPGLKLVTRADIMERSWGATRAAGNYPAAANNSDVNSSGSTLENENIAFDLLYVQYVSPIGIFRVGYQDDGAWGTVFGDTMQPQPKITYLFAKGGLVAGGYILKYKEASITGKAPANTAGLGNMADNDVDMYAAFVNYTFKQGAAGLLFKHYRNAYFKGLPAALGYQYSQQFTAALPYAKVKFGPVSAEAEVIYVFGTHAKYDQGAVGENVDYNMLSAYLKVGADFGMAYVNVTLAKAAGDDKTTPAIREGSGNGGTDWNPCLIMFNFDRYYWAGKLTGHNASQNPNVKDTGTLSTNDAGMTNAWFASLNGGVRPMDKLDINMAISWARAIENPAITAWYSKEYGYEFDLTATYKITNNLSYMLGGGYWWVGDYYKGALETNKVQNDYLLINKLTLTF